METNFFVTGDTLLVSLVGEIDHHVAERVRNDIDSEVVLYGIANLILDFSKVSFMDSSGVGMVLGRYKKMNEKGGTVVIRNCDRLVRQILDMSGVFSLVKYEEAPIEGGKHGK